MGPATRSPSALVVLALALALASCGGTQELRVATVAREDPPAASGVAPPGPRAPRPAPVLPEHCRDDEARLPTGCFGLLGSRWRLKVNLPRGGLRIFVVAFEPNGRMVDGDPSNNTPDDDEWSQDGDAVQFHFNGRYASYEATLRSELQITGRATNRANEHWTFLADRVYGRGTP